MVVETSEWFRRFATYEAAGSSPSYERLARYVAEDSGLLQRLDTLEPPKRQPNLLFASVQLLGGPLGDVEAFESFVVDRWADVAVVMRERSTQTNEAARTAAFLPLLARIDGPLALIEVGAAAGLCLYPDRYAIRYDGRPALTASPVEIDVVTSGSVPIPARLPEIVDRVAIDLNPLDVMNREDLAWLHACIWPEHHKRRHRLSAAVEVVAALPPRLVRGDLTALIDDQLGDVPDGVTPVVFHSAVLSYLDPDPRADFASRMSDHPKAVWISNEAPGVIPGLVTNLRPPPFATSAAYFIVGRNGRTAVGRSDPHGAWLAGPNVAGEVARNSSAWWHCYYSPVHGVASVYTQLRWQR